MSKENMPKLGARPKIGIRPAIDGRRGPLKVREGLEAQTMAMAAAAKKLFEENIFYSDGKPVEVVIADTTIGRVAETGRPDAGQELPANRLHLHGHRRFHHRLRVH